MPGRAGRCRASRPPTAQAGAASVWILLAAGVCLVVAAGAVAVAAATVARHRAAAAADLAALAAAEHLLPWVPFGAAPATPCSAAAQAAAAGGARLVACTVSSPSVVVRVAVGLPGLLAVAGEARAVARAGPGPP